MVNNNRRRFLLLPAVAIMVILTTNCQSEEKRIQNIAEQFLQAYYVDYDYKKAEELATIESRLTIANKKDAVETNLFADQERATIIIQKVSIVGEFYATVEYLGNDMLRRVVLVKKDKEWKVDTIESGIDGSSLAPNAKSGHASSSPSEPATKIETKADNKTIN